MTRYFSVHVALDIAEAVLFAELMTFVVLFTLTRLDAFRVQYRSSMDYCSRLGPSQPESSCVSWPGKTMTG
jgi:hypothetical protein